MRRMVQYYPGIDGFLEHPPDEGEPTVFRCMFLLCLQVGHTKNKVMIVLFILSTLCWIFWIFHGRVSLVAAVDISTII